MACRLIGAKPFSEPMVECCQFRPLGTYFSEILIVIPTISLKKMHFKMSLSRQPPFCFAFNMLNHPVKMAYIWAGCKTHYLYNARTGKSNNHHSMYRDFHIYIYTYMRRRRCIIIFESWVYLALTDGGFISPCRERSIFSCAADYSLLRTM